MVRCGVPLKEGGEVVYCLGISVVSISGHSLGATTLIVLFKLACIWSVHLECGSRAMFLITHLNQSSLARDALTSSVRHYLPPKRTVRRSLRREVPRGVGDSEAGFCQQQWMCIFLMCKLLWRSSGERNEEVLEPRNFGYEATSSL